MRGFKVLDYKGVYCVTNNATLPVIVNRHVLVTVAVCSVLIAIMLILVVISRVSSKINILLETLLINSFILLA